MSNNEIKQVKPGHKYWEWKPGKKKDNWEPLKKNGRKKGTVMLKEAEVELEIGTIVNYLTFWKSKIENAQNKKMWLKPKSPMNVAQACREFGIHPNTFYDHLRKFPAMKDKYEALKANKREYLKDIAESTMIDVLVDGDMTDKEKFDASMKVAQATMKEYNPKTEIETKSIGININKSSEDLMEDLKKIIPWLQTDG